MTAVILISLAVCIPLPLILTALSRPRVDPLDPFLLMLLPFVLGSSLRLVYLALAGEAGAARMLYGADTQIMLTGAMAAAWGTSALAIGAFAARSLLPGTRVSSSSPAGRAGFSRERLVIVAIGSLLLFIVGYEILSRFRDIPPLLEVFSLQGIAALARTRVTQIGSNVEAGTTFQFAAVFFWVSEAAYFVALVCGVKSGNWRTWIFPVVGLLILVILAGIVNGSRTQSVRVLIVTWLFLLGCGYRRFFWASLPVVVLGMVLLIGTLGFVRSADEQAVASLGQAEASGHTFATILEGGHFVDAARLGMIITHVPERFDYLLGDSYTSLLAAWIPRVVWPEKPAIDDGIYVKRFIYNEPGSFGSYPAGMLGQAYMNFSFFGLAVIPVLIGFVIERIYTLFRRNRTDVVVVSAFLIVVWPLAIDLMQSAFAGVVMGILLKLPMCIVIGRFVATPQSRRRTSSLLAVPNATPQS